MLWSTIFVYLWVVMVIGACVSWVVHLRKVRAAERVNRRVRAL